MRNNLILVLTLTARVQVAFPTLGSDPVITFMLTFTLRLIRIQTKPNPKFVPGLSQLAIGGLLLNKPVGKKTGRE
eukprot:1341297-Amorphochlora_amoeboformis.AAC.1